MVKVRFAPSPTGFLHMGSARTALFNWIFARHHGGQFLIRIEDTDLSRSKKEFLDEIILDLKWLGMNWDGELTFQSKRFDVYRDTAKKLLEDGKAYRDGEAYIFKVEKGRNVEIDDMIHGKITVNTDEIKDQVMIKSDGSPAYNFACVVDDIYLGVTHIIRGDDHVSNTPKQVLFYEALGAVPPVFGHMPLIMGIDGAKLSKRHGGVSVEEYKQEGFLPEALTNYLLLLGWSPGEDREIISLEEAVKLFDIKDMKGVQAKFDIQKLRWVNGEYIMGKTPDDLLPLVKERLAGTAERGTDDDERLKKIIALFQPRAKTLSEMISMTDYFFTDSYTVDEKGKEKYLTGDDDLKAVKLFAEKLDAAEEFTHGSAEEICRALAGELGVKAGAVIHPTRMALSGKTAGAGLFEMMEVLGKDKVLERMRKAAA